MADWPGERAMCRRRSPAVLAMKREAYQRKQQLLGSMPEQQRRQHQQRQRQQRPQRARA